MATKIFQQIHLNNLLPDRLLAGAHFKEYVATMEEPVARVLLTTVGTDSVFKLEVLDIKIKIFIH